MSPANAPEGHGSDGYPKTLAGAELLGRALLAAALLERLLLRLLLLLLRLLGTLTQDDLQVGARCLLTLPKNSLADG